MTGTRYTPEKLLAALDDLGLKTSTHHHEAVFRVGEGDDIKAQLPGAHTKNLFLKDDKGQLWLISAEQTTQINLKALPKMIGSGRLSFGSEQRLFDALGVRPGSVTALALIHDPEHRVKFLLDKVLAEAETVNFHPLTNTATTALSQSDFRAFLASLGREPVVVDFTTVV
ncbi:prolyl-tRNA synthetase associated domain-containing protein [Asticcacaulis sp. EMRT-3]|uniref:prolyl-tRNA synthetase associated domain-containing protein n=1 Tax=Asticcacaulis sp. EMRT-3 TaxID=3040349 RepID=UPI0024AEAAB4|nr:prolyl-tRNA synthetase associated domain-containing protein [Asticcacaulis sp. EMRT-3]MDI7775791.1 prolyl-tRNA synthetase associated domain-containing protein [Asticcacaulis sp. EMRT-3]